ncbi:MAG TPA: WD40 repeat domain-containing protein [Candidatus Thermoplasmatota archaeon]|jgi:hypothetical protein|nr:WD40 repeat domain-containing protein [Candidatus Thermoplasmatota archaeon]
MARAPAAALLCVLALALPMPPASALGPEPVVVDLGAAAHALAASARGDLVAFATADGVVATTAAGGERWRALDGLDVRAVAVDRQGTLVAAGDTTGLVHVLDAGDGALVAVAVTLGAVNALAFDDAGANLVAGSDDGFTYVYKPRDSLPPPLPDAALPLLLPQWSYNTDLRVTHVLITADGRWVVAGNGDDSRAWLWQNTPALLPGGVPPAPFPCLNSGIAGPNCWVFQQGSAGGLHVLAAAHDSYDMFISYGTGWSIATRAGNFFANPWSFLAPATPTAGAMAASGSHALVGDSLGNVFYLDTAPHNPPHEKQALWSSKRAVEVRAAALSPDGRWAAVGDADGTFALHDGPAGPAAVWTYAALGGAAGLAFTSSGTLSGAAGSQALFWA